MQVKNKQKCQYFYYNLNIIFNKACDTSQSG